MVAIGEGVMEDGFWLVLLVIAFAFLWFHQPSEPRIKQSKLVMSETTRKSRQGHKKAA